VPKQSSPKEEKNFKEINSSKSTQNNQGHVYLPPFGIIEKG